MQFTLRRIGSTRLTGTAERYAKAGSAPRLIPVKALAPGRATLDSDAGREPAQEVQ